jgi:hypothetical protein
MRRLSLVLSFAVLAGCGAVGDDDEADDSCSTPGAERCNGDNIEKCQNDGTYEVIDFCGANPPNTCIEGAAGPRCGTDNEITLDDDPATAAPDFPDTDALVNPANFYATIDVDVVVGSVVDGQLWQSVISWTTIDGLDYEIELENYMQPPSFVGKTPGTTGTVVITGQNTNYASCAVCLLGRIYDGGGNVTKEFYASEGSIEFVQWGDKPGEAIDIVLNDVVFTEVEIDYEGDFTSTPVDGGDRWIFEEVVMTGVSDNMPCDYFDWDLGDGWFVAGDTFCTGVDGTKVLNCVAADVDYFEAETCSAGRCVATSSTLFTDECGTTCVTLGDLTCDGDDVRECFDVLFPATGNYAVLSEACPDTCGDIGGDAACVDSCANTTHTRCAGTTLESCTVGLYYAPVTCANGGDVCYDSTPAFDDATAACFAPCTGSVTRCNSTSPNTLETCNGTVYATATDCTATTQVCEVMASGAVCTAACDGATEGQTRCNGNVQETCGTGTWGTPVDCGAGTCGGEPAACIPN